MLDFTYPEIFRGVIHALKPLLDVWELFFRALGPSECFGIKGFASKWLLRVVGLPGVFSALIITHWLWSRRQVSAEQARVQAKGELFLAVFFCECAPSRSHLSCHVENTRDPLAVSLPCAR